MSPLSSASSSSTFIASRRALFHMDSTSSSRSHNLQLRRVLRADNKAAISFILDNEDSNAPTPRRSSRVSRSAADAIAHDFASSAHPRNNTQVDHKHEQRDFISTSRVHQSNNQPPRFVATPVPSTSYSSGKAPERATRESQQSPPSPALRPQTSMAQKQPQSEQQQQQKTKIIKKSRMCKFENCTRYVVNRGLCIGHGGGKRCSVSGCTSSAKNLGLCWKHGGSTKCTVEGCNNRAKARGVCWSHGGGKKCHVDECNKTAVSNGLCWAHGGGKRCAVEGCKKPAYERNGNLCSAHYEEYRYV